MRAAKEPSRPRPSGHCANSPPSEVIGWKVSVRPPAASALTKKLGLPPAPSLRYWKIAPLPIAHNTPSGSSTSRVCPPRVRRTPCYIKREGVRSRLAEDDPRRLKGVHVLRQAPRSFPRANESKSACPSATWGLPTANSPRSRRWTRPPATPRSPFAVGDK